LKSLRKKDGTTKKLSRQFLTSLLYRKHPPT